MRAFLWKGSTGSGLAKVSWDHVCKSKEEGGLGLRRVLYMNQALMLKNVWRLLQEDPNSIWVAWVLRYRLRRHSIWTVNTTTASWCWKQLVKASFLIKDGIEYRVGYGNRFRIWTDLWHPSSPLIHTFPRGPILSGLPKDARLLMVIRQGQWCWPAETETEIQQIMAALPALHPQQSDQILWKQGMFSTQSVLQFLYPPSSPVIWHRLLGGKFGIPRHNFILWLAFLERLSTLDRIWSSSMGQQCVLCGGSKWRLTNISSSAVPLRNDVWKFLNGMFGLVGLTWVGRLILFGPQGGGEVGICSMRHLGRSLHPLCTMFGVSVIVVYFQTLRHQLRLWLVVLWRRFGFG
ncbi:UNVERIFIED_CONTAM: hypothetical protein Sradi_6895300 [Sesamum radiatum]|uniref:Reverse transcriptase zinc-binding domain-containing protein n=1 Tax=Sesamum radiatum TaxID=300843 RepID=A0AAW2JIP0_SESRA